MLAETRGRKNKITAEKSYLKQLRVYHFYQEYLEKEKLLDFGELIYRCPFKLLQQK